MGSNALLSMLRHGWLALDPLNMPMAVVGGLALSAWNHARYTRDADLLIGVDEPRIDEILVALTSAGFDARHSPPVLQIDQQKIVQWKFVPPGGNYPFQLDVLLAIPGYQDDALARRVNQRIPGLDHPVQVLRPDDLILMKLAAGRIIDRADAAMLLRENRDDIEMNYLLGWIKGLGLDGPFAEIWRDAFPDQALPELS